MTPDERLDQLWDILRDWKLEDRIRVDMALKVLRETKDDPKCSVVFECDGHGHVASGKMRIEDGFHIEFDYETQIASVVPNTE